MRLGVRGKLFLITILAVVAVELAAGFFLEHELRHALETRVENELVRHAKAARDLLEERAPARDPEILDAIADRVGESVSGRITVIAEDGTVLGDSELSVEELQSVDDHANRPEVVAAGRDGVGVSRRFSDTIQLDMLYVAVPFEAESLRGSVRVSKPLSELDEAGDSLVIILVLAGLLALAIAGITAGLLSHFLSRTLRTLVGTAHAMADSTGHGAPSADESGGAAGPFSRMAQDLEQTVSALADERNRFQSVLESMNEAVVALDPEDRITTVNRAARQLLGLTGKLTERKLRDEVSIPELGDVVAAAHDGESTDVEFDLLDRGRRRVLARADPQAGGGAVIVMHDVTEIRRLETVRRDFVANVSHELRTPVSVIRANAETLLDSALERPDDARRFLEATLRHADRLSRLVADLLDISRIEAGKYHISPSKVPIAPIVKRVADIVEARAESRRMELILNVGDEIEAIVDPRALEQVLVNLVDNALKYAPEEGRVEVAAVVTGQRLRIEVRDDGPGIDPAHRARIFERFYRIDPGRSRDMGGTGLGLAIVRHLIEAMRGQVGVEGRSPRGSVFWVAVPIDEV